MGYYDKNYQEKKEYLVRMLEQIRQAHQIFEQLYEVVNQPTDHDESLYDELYETIKALGNDLQTLSKKQQESLLFKTQNIMQKIRDEEEKDRLKEQEGLDALLNG